MPPNVIETSMYVAHCLSVVALCSVSTSEKSNVHRARPMYTLRCWTAEQGETTNHHSNTLQQRHLHIRVRSGCTTQAGRRTSSKSENSISPSLVSLPLPCSSFSRHELKQRQLSSTKVIQIYRSDWSKRVRMFHQIHPAEPLAIRTRLALLVVTPNDVSKSIRISVMNSYRKSSNFPCSVRCARSFSGESRCIRIEQLNLLFSTGASRIKVINVNGANASCIGNATISLHVHVKRRNTLMSAILDPLWPIYLSFLQLNINVAHHFEQQPFTLKPFFCDHCGSFIRPGHAHKCSRKLLIELTWHILTVVCSSLRLRDDRSSSLYVECRQLLWMWKERLGFVRGMESEGEFSQRWQMLIRCRSLQHVYEPGSSYQYNEDLYEIYSVLDNPERQPNITEGIERASKIYRPSITPGLNFNQFRIIRVLGQGMNGSVSDLPVSFCDTQSREKERIIRLSPRHTSCACQRVIECLFFSVHWISSLKNPEGACGYFMS